MLLRIVLSAFAFLSLLWQQFAGSSAHPAEAVSAEKKGRYIPELYGALQGKYIRDDSGRYQHVPVPYDGGYGDHGQKYVFVQNIRDALISKHESFKLGPNDHLRFTIDFNYEGNGLQVVHFKWLREDDEKRNFDYMHEHQLWEPTAENELYMGNSKVLEEDATANWNQQVETEVQTDGPQAERPGKSDGLDVGVDNVAIADSTPEDDMDITEHTIHSKLDFEQDKVTQDDDAATEHVSDSANDLLSTDYETELNDKGNVLAIIGEVLSYIQTHILPTLQ